MRKKIFILLGVMFLTSYNQTMAECAISSNAENCFALKYQRYIEHLQQNRATVYNALNLSDKQINFKEELIQKNSQIYNEKFQKLYCESSKLNTLEKAKANEIEIYKQKNVVKKIKNDINDLIEKENKEFKKCLTREQRAKFAMIKKLEHDDFKKTYKHPKNYLKSNPQMRAFGMPLKENCTCPKSCYKEVK